MTSIARHRTHHTDGFTGHAHLIDPPIDLGSNSVYVAQDMDDVIGNRGGNNPLYGLKQCTWEWVVNGKNRPEDYLAINYENYPTGGYEPGWVLNFATSRPSVSRAYVQGLALTNPNRPHVDVPVFLAELRDIPRLIKDWGELLLVAHNHSYMKNMHLANEIADLPGFTLHPDFRKRIPNPKLYKEYTLASVPRSVGKRYLEWQFGIAPYFKDVARMIDVITNADKKFGVLKHLQQGSSHRHATVWSETVVGSDLNNYVSPLYQEYNRFGSHWELEGRTWVSTTWKPLFPELFPNNDKDLLMLARRLSSGADISLATLWEGMPWSWLIDWFGNVGDIIQATRNALPVDHSDSCVMESKILRRKGFYWIVNGGSLRISFPQFHLKEIKRTAAPLVVYPEFSLPFVDGGQLSILSALASSGLKNARVK